MAFFENRTSDIHCRPSTSLKFEKHLHTNVEFVVMLEGKTRAYADNKGGVLSAGQAFIVFPNQIHHYTDDLGEYYCLIFIFDPKTLPSFYKKFMKYTPKEPIIDFDSNKLLSLYHLILCEINTPTEYSKNILENSLGVILSYVFRNMEFMEVDKTHLTALQTVLQYCNEHYTENITLDSIAQNIHMNKYYISHVFNKEIGISLPEYLNTLRIRDATMLLKEGNMSITDIAFAVGFNTLRSFNRRFLEHTGKTPKQIKNEYKSMDPETRFELNF